MDKAKTDEFLNKTAESIKPYIEAVKSFLEISLSTILSEEKEDFSILL